MEFRINTLLADDEFKRHQAPARHYLEALREKNLLIEIGNVMVDAEQLVLRTFQCDTGYCVKCSGPGAKAQYKGSCCTDLQVDITPYEAEKVEELARLAQEKLDLNARDPVGAVVESILKGKAFGINDDKELAFKHKKNGACAMSWIEGEGALRCTINTLCMRLGLPIEEFKPAPCFLFPLHYCEIERNKYILSILSEETRYWIEQHRDVTKLRCLSRPQPGSPSAYVFLRAEIERLFSKRFYKELDEHARPILQKRLEEDRPQGRRKG